MIYWFLFQGVIKIITIVLAALILASQVHLCFATLLVNLLVLTYFLQSAVLPSRVRDYTISHQPYLMAHGR